MVSNTLKLLIQAAKERRCAVIRYDGQHLIRVVEPHAIYTDQNGTIIAECYQTRGFAEGEKPVPSWKLFELGKIRSVFLLNTTFRARFKQGFNPRRPEYAHGLVALVNDPASFAAHSVPDSDDGGTRPTTLFHQARDIWWEVGSAIDRFLSDKDWGPRRN